LAIFKICTNRTFADALPEWEVAGAYARQRLDKGAAARLRASRL
jgi:hypothetical protein